MLRALVRMCAFYGVASPRATAAAGSGGTASSDISADLSSGAVSGQLPPAGATAAAPAAEVPWWAEVSFDHNHLRITRILRSLRLFGLEAEAAEFHAQLVAVARRGAVNRRSLGYWQRAVSEPLFSSLQ